MSGTLKLYDIEREAKRSAGGKSGETALFKARKTARARSASVVDEYFRLCRRSVGAHMPSMPVAKAARYSANHEEGLRKFLSALRLNIDSNLAENVVRPWCVGRKKAGRNAAPLESFAATCKACDVGVDFKA